jgi:chloramphenicol-sensitive protein RarD
LTVTATPIPADAQRRTQSGLAVALVCYLLWGFLPLLFHALEPVNSVTVVAHRTVWALLFVGLVLAGRRGLGEVRAALADPQTLRSMLVSSALLAVNWLSYVWAVQSGQVLEGSLGYFINPIVNVAIGMVLLRERLTRWQAVSIGVAIVAIAVQWWGIGRLPYLALTIATSFGFYGYFRKTAKVGSASGLFVETLILTPVALGWIGFSLWQAGGPGPTADPTMLALLVLTGPATAVPLLLFAFAVQRLRLATIGMLQYLSPSIQFLIAVFLLHEPLNEQQLLSFALIWVSLAIYSADSLMRRNRAMG